MARADTSGTHIYLVMLKALRALQRHAAKSFEQMGLGFSDFKILETLLNRGPQLVSDVGRRIDLTSGSMTTAVDRLEKRGLVRRSAHKSDRRARVVSLTPQGKSLIAKVFAEHKREMDATATGLNEKERVSLLTLLKKLGRGAEGLKVDEAGDVVGAVDQPCD